MADFSIRIKAEQLGKSLENLAYEVEEELGSAIDNMANMAFASIQANAQTELNSTRQDYLKGLDMQKIGDHSYLIVLDGDWPNAIERGFSGFDMREWMLKSEKIVGIGVRSGQKWVQEGAEGQKFAHVPFQKQPFSKAAASADMNQAIRKLTATNAQGVSQKFTSMFRDASGAPIEGRVASVRKVEGFPNLGGITKYQRKYKDEKTGKETMQSHYLVFRTISENGEGFQHPGYGGAHFFDDAEKWIDAEIENILNAIIK